ncbi:ABC transporter-domain-containing protein [Flagelloscypha sp. PMI_526]|nr:ABC transporter-domain-containing protein [Flagelloscypha sp. PMI_526]
MSPVAATTEHATDWPAFLDALKTAPTAPDAKAAADRLAKQISIAGLHVLSEQGIFATLQAFANNKKSGYERESAPIAFQSFAAILGPFCSPIVAVKAIVKILPPEATRVLFSTLAKILESAKWRSKVGVLDTMRAFINSAKEQVGEQLASIIPTVESAMHDTKSEVSSAAIKCATALCNTLANPDLTAHIPALVKCMQNPDSVPGCIKSMSNTTFVAEVTAPALAVLVPLLLRALNDRSMEVQRRTVVVIDNLVKLVRDPNVAAHYLSPLVEGVEKVAKGAAFPEVPCFRQGASKSGGSSLQRDILTEEAEVLSVLINKLSDEFATPSTITPNGLPQPKHPLFQDVLHFEASLLSDIVFARKFGDTDTWRRCLSVYMTPWSNSEVADAYMEDVRAHFIAADQAKHGGPAVETDEEGEVLCNTLFSLAYGALLLLSHTTLRLIRGRRYGILGTNGSGKSTLMRQLQLGKVENFPPQSELRCVMVEHSLQGEDTSLSVLDFIASDGALSDVPRDAIRKQLRDVGFDDNRQADIVGSLSGGWKMKLELARAMLYNADLLLLGRTDQSCTLDRASVQWLEQWLMSKNITCLIVSHDSKFLDTITTDIIHYESKKLVYYKGNLSRFVEIHPEAKSYYTLAATSVKFAFPPPGSLMGVRSPTRAILKMQNCTFTYPGRTTPSLFNVSCALSLSSRVGVVGPNGAGKSTLIKLLTGETSPQEGNVYKHPALRVGYVSQHATHHIEKHLEKTPIQYIQWRFQDGHDRELLEKSTRVLTEEEQRVLDQEWVGRDGSKRKLELIMGRQKLKKTFQYEVKWRGFDHKWNTWVARDDLIAKGLSKLVQQFDDLESSREGAGTRDTKADIVRKHLEDIGLDGDIAQYNEISGLSGGQKIKLVIAACLWNNPQICVLDEPSNFLDREALGGLAVAIRDWAGAVVRWLRFRCYKIPTQRILSFPSLQVIISHNHEFVGALCPEIWNVEAGRLTHKGTAATIEDAFLDGKSPKGSGTNTPVRSRLHTPAASAAGTPAGSGAEDTGASPVPVKKKKKPTRNQMKAQEERRRLRKLRWLSEGGPKPEDTDSD